MPCTPVDLPSIVPAFNQIVYRAGQRHTYLTMLPKSAETRRKQLLQFLSILFGGKNKMEVYNSNKKEKPFSFLHKKITQLGLVAILQHTLFPAL